MDAESNAAADTPTGTAADMYDAVLSDEEKATLRKQAEQQVSDVEQSLVREHYEISHRPVQTEADKARLAEIDRILTERRA